MSCAIRSRLKSRDKQQKGLVLVSLRRCAGSCHTPHTAGNLVATPWFPKSELDSLLANSNLLLRLRSTYLIRSPRTFNLITRTTGEELCLKGRTFCFLIIFHIFPLILSFPSLFSCQWHLCPMCSRYPSPKSTTKLHSSGLLYFGIMKYVFFRCC